jgi:hypothetical protein
LTFTETASRRAVLTLVLGTAISCLFGVAAGAATADTVTNASDSAPGSLWATIAEVGRAMLRIRTGRRSTTRLVRVFKIKTVRLSAAGERRLMLVLTRKGRKTLRNLNEVRLVIAGKAIDATGKTASLDRRVLDLG